MDQSIPNHQAAQPSQEHHAPSPASTKKINKNLFIIGGIIIVVLVFGVLSLLVVKKLLNNQTAVSVPLSSSITPTPTTLLKTEYENPFDEKSNYENPFAESKDYKNPFDTGQ